MTKGRGKSASGSVKAQTRGVLMESSNDNRKRSGLPLYKVIESELVRRIETGAWRPGQVIPNEFDIAKEFNVAQGTARRALACLADRGLVVRYQGRGTFVAEYTAQNTPHRFFNFVDERGRKVQLDVGPSRAYHGEATADEARMLEIEVGTQVVRIKRVRRRDDTPFLIDAIVLPAALFPGITTRNALPNTLYDLYQHEFGVTIAQAEEHLTVAVAAPEIAAQLSLPAATAVMKTDRVARDVAGRAVEWRTSYVNLGSARYVAKLSLT
jgi:GntR family transcriptional regulator